MRWFVAQWCTSFGHPDDLPDVIPDWEPAYEQLKATYQGWAAMQWAEQHGQVVSADEVSTCWV